MTKKELQTEIAQCIINIKHINSLHLDAINEKLKIESDLSYWHTIHTQYDRQLALIDGRHTPIKTKNTRKTYTKKPKNNSINEMELMKILRTMDKDKRKEWIAKITTQVGKITPITPIIK